MNIQNIIKEASAILNENQIITSILDSEILLAKIIKKDRKYVVMNSKENLTIKQVKDFRRLIFKRSKGQPIAYLTNSKDFWNYKFFIKKNVLIPRPDTELLIREALKFVKNKKDLSILDIGTGSGCILLTLVKELKNLRGVGVDISKKCIEISKINADKLNLSSRVKFYKSNIDNFNIGKYDIIISNPPYIRKHLIKYLEKDVAGFEPRLALDGGLDGVTEIRKFINKSSKLIKKNGKFILEIAFDQKNIVKDLLNKKGFYINKILKDYANNDRCVVSTKIN